MREFSMPISRRSRASRAAVTTCSLLLLPACTHADRDEDSTLVLAAASTIVALEAAVADFEQRTGNDVDVSFGPTSTVARQIEEGARADLMLSASREWGDYVEERADVDRRAVLVSNRLTVIGPMNAPGGSQNIREFLADAKHLRLAIADPESVPAGIYARQSLEALGLWETVHPRLIRTVDVRAALALVVAGEVDGAFVYATDAANTDDVTRIGEIDTVLHEPIEYPLLLLAGAGEQATKLFEFLISERGRAHFLDRGFINPDP